MSFNAIDLLTQDLCFVMVSTTYYGEKNKSRHSYHYSPLTHEIFVYTIISFFFKENISSYYVERSHCISEQRVYGTHTGTIVSYPWFKLILVHFGVVFLFTVKTV